LVALSACAVLGIAAFAAQSPNPPAQTPPAAPTAPGQPAPRADPYANNAPPGAKIWNPVKLKMMQGGKTTGGTLFSATDPATYCAMAGAGYDFIWTEMQHYSRDWEQAARMWRTCPNARAVP